MDAKEHSIRYQEAHIRELEQRIERDERELRNLPNIKKNLESDIYRCKQYLVNARERLARLKSEPG